MLLSAFEYGEINYALIKYLMSEKGVSLERLCKNGDSVLVSLQQKDFLEDEDIIVLLLFLIKDNFSEIFVLIIKNQMYKAIEVLVELPNVMPLCFKLFGTSRLFASK